MPTPIRFIFDFISPYAYLAWKGIHALGDEAGRTIEPHPALFAAMLNQYGHLGPAEIPPKREYIFKNCVRIAHRMGVPLTPPPAHPFNPLTALRVATLAEPESQRAVIDALFDAAWADGRGVQAPEDVVECLSGAGFDGRGLVDRSQRPENKQLLRERTEEALQLGVFGVPTIVVEGELFWGLDAFPDVRDFLRGEDPVDPTALARWAEIPAAATRRS